MEKSNRVTVSVLTPTWNRSTYLPTVWEGLQSQSFKDFEWIVANDGSADNTVEVVIDLAKKSSFPVTLISSSMRVGKSRMDNEAVRAARGEFILWCDSDDWLMPNALEVLVNTWLSIPEADRYQFAGVTALCDSKSGILDNIFPDTAYTDIKWNDLLSRMTHDMVLFCRADELKNVPFLEVDYLIPETSVWYAIGTKKTRFIPIALHYRNYRSDHCISYSGLMEYNRGRAYALALSRKYLSEQNSNIKDRIWRFITYLRYCIHGDITLTHALEMWAGGMNAILAALFALPIASALALKDYAQGKVKKTHRDFLRAQHEAVTTVTKVN